MQIALLLRVLDLAVLGFTAYHDHQAQSAQQKQDRELIAALRARILAGEIDEAEALAQLDQIIGGIIGRRRAALAKLPKPTGQTDG